MTDLGAEKRSLKSTYSYILLLFALYFGTVLYDLISAAGFTYTDEILVLTLALSVVVCNRIDVKLLCFIGVSLFFLVFSLIAGINVREAALMDYLIQIKPFLGFYCVYNLGLKLNNYHKRKLSCHVVILAIILFLGSLVDYKLFVETIPGHPSRFATTFIILGFLYYYSSRRRNVDILVSLLIWCVSILSFRSKAYGFVAIAIILFLFTGREFYRKFKLSTLLGILCICAAAVFFAREKFFIYFIEGLSDGDVDNMLARPALYAGGWSILQDHPLLGSGLGSFATYASSVFYSPVYYEYGLDQIYGLSPIPGGGDYICDTFYPSLAQFGIVGIILFIYFFTKRFVQARRRYRATGDLRTFIMCILIIAFFVIESTSDATFTQNRGMVMMMIYALLLHDNKARLSISNNNESI